MIAAMSKKKATRSGGSFGLLLVSARSDFFFLRLPCLLPPSLWGKSIS